MKAITKTNLFLLSLFLLPSLFCAQPNVQPVNPDAPQSPFYINTDTGLIVDQSGNSLDVQKIIGPVVNPISLSDNLSNALRIIRGLTVDNPLTAAERLAITGTLIGIDMIDACHTLLSAHSYADNGTKIGYPDILKFIASAAGNKILSPDTSTLEIIKNQLISENNLALTKGVVQFFVDQGKNQILNQIVKLNQDKLKSGFTVKEINDFTQITTKSLDIVGRLITGESTFVDRCYFKIVKFATSTAEWIRTKIFKKPSIRESIGTDIVNAILENDKVQALYKSAEIVAEKAGDVAAMVGEKIFDTIKWTIKTVENTKEAVSKATTTIANKSYDIVTYITQESESAYATVTQKISSGADTIEHVFTVTRNKVTDNFEFAKTIAESALETLKNSPTSPEQALNMLQASVTGAKNAAIKMLDTSIQFIENTPAVIASAAVDFIISGNNTGAKLTLLTALMLTNPEAFDLLVPDEVVPNSHDILSDVTTMYDEMNNLFNTKVNDLIDEINKFSGTEPEKIDAAIQTEKQNSIKAAFDALALTDFIDAQGKYLFNIDELVKDNVTITLAKEHITDLLNNATSRSDKISAQTLLSDIDTALANRAPDLTPDQEKEYKTLKGQLDEYAKGILETNDQFFKWVKNLSTDQLDLIRADLDVAIFKETIAQTTDKIGQTTSVNDLIEYKNILSDFIMGAESFGYGSLADLSNPTNATEKSFEDILVKAGINSPAQQQQLFDTIISIDQRLSSMLLDNYKSALILNKETNFLDSITNIADTPSDQLNAFNALSNEAKINFISNLQGITQDQRDGYITKALQATIDAATTAQDLLNLQKDTFARGDVVLQALQDKIKTVLTDEYKYLSPNDQYNFKRSMLDPQDLTDYSRAFKTLSLSDQKSIASSLGIADIELKTFQKAFLSEKIFYAKTIDELNTLKADINALNAVDQTYFTNQDITGKHGFDFIGDALITKTQDILTEKINNNAFFTGTDLNSTDYFKTTLLDFSSQDPYATAFRELPLLKQNEIAQSIKLDQDPKFKEFLSSLVNDEISIATDQATLKILLNDAVTLKLDAKTINAAEVRFNQSTNSTLSPESITARQAPIDLSNIPASHEIDPTHQTPEINPTAPEIEKQTSDDTLSGDLYFDASDKTAEEQKEQEEYEEEQIAQKTEAAGEIEAAQQEYGAGGEAHGG